MGWNGARWGVTYLFCFTVFCLDLSHRLFNFFLKKQKITLCAVCFLCPKSHLFLKRSTAPPYREYAVSKMPSNLDDLLLSFVSKTLSPPLVAAD
jgi:hypothetical protein